MEDRTEQQVTNDLLREFLELAQKIFDYILERDVAFCTSPSKPAVMAVVEKYKRGNDERTS